MHTLAKLTVIASASLGIMTTVATRAHAGILDTETHTLTLKFDARDLGTDRGAERLLSRVSAAATKVCDPGGSMVDIIENSAYRACLRDAIARAVAEVDRPTLTAVFNRHYGERGAQAAVAAIPALAGERVALK